MNSKQSPTKRLNLEIWCSERRSKSLFSLTLLSICNSIKPQSLFSYNGGNTSVEAGSDGEIRSSSNQGHDYSLHCNEDHRHLDI